MVSSRLKIHYTTFFSFIKSKTKFVFKNETNFKTALVSNYLDVEAS